MLQALKAAWPRGDPRGVLQSAATSHRAQAPIRTGAMHACNRVCGVTGAAGGALARSSWAQWYSAAAAVEERPGVEDRHAPPSTAPPVSTYPIVSAESANLAARRHIGWVPLPQFLVTPPIDAAKGLGLSPKNIRAIAENLRDRIKKLTVTTGKGGARAFPINAPRTPRLPDTLPQLPSLPAPDVPARSEPLLRLPGRSGRGLPIAKAHRKLPELGRRELPVPGAKARPVDAKAALAFTVDQLPGRFAAVTRVLEEIRFRHPGFEPADVLDYQAGPGVGLWAAFQLWGTAVQRVTAVEPQPAMLHMGLRIQDAVQQHDPLRPMPSVRWLKSLPKRPRGQTGGRAAPPDARRYGLVVAAHTLAAETDKAVRARLVRDLWARCGGMMLLLEPGTPVGSAVVREARALILEDEANRTAQLQVAATQLAALEDLLGVPAEASMPGDGPAAALGDRPSQAAERPAWPEGVPAMNSVQSNLDATDLHAALAGLRARTQQLRWEATGVHVVAPCAHDGVCPMDETGSRSWCHFRQRFERTHLHRMCKIRKGADLGPKNWQYERFSYVVLRRGDRRQVPTDVLIEPTFKTFPEDMLAYIGVPGPLLAAAADPGADPREAGREAFPFLADAQDAAAAEVQERKDAAEELAQQLARQHSRKSLTADKADEDADDDEQDGQVEGQDAAEGGPDGQPLWDADTFLDDYLRSVVALGERTEGALPTASMSSLRLRLQESAAEDSAAAVDAPASEEAPAKEETGRAGGRRDSSASAAGSGHRANAGASARSQANGPGTSMPRGWDAAAAAGARGRGSEMPGTGQQVHLGSAQDCAAVRAGQAETTLSGGPGSGSRARDVDAGAPHAGVGQSCDDGQDSDREEDEQWLRGRNWAKEDPEGLALGRTASACWSRLIRTPLKRRHHVVLDLCVAARDQRAGALERHIIARSDRHRAWLGPAAYRLARAAKWGDLWPSVYHRNPRVRPGR